MAIPGKLDLFTFFKQTRQQWAFAVVAVGAQARRIEIRTQ